MCTNQAIESNLICIFWDTENIISYIFWDTENIISYIFWDTENIISCIFWDTENIISYIFWNIKSNSLSTFQNMSGIVLKQRNTWVPSQKISTKGGHAEDTWVTRLLFFGRPPLAA